MDGRLSFEAILGEAARMVAPSSPQAAPTQLRLALRASPRHRPSAIISLQRLVTPASARAHTRSARPVDNDDVARKIAHATDAPARTSADAGPTLRVLRCLGRSPTPASLEREHASARLSEKLMVHDALRASRRAWPRPRATMLARQLDGRTCGSFRTVLGIHWTHGCQCCNELQRAALS